MSFTPKFKVGEIIQDSSDRSYQFKVIKHAKKGEEVTGDWYDSTKNKTMPDDCYVLEGYRSKIMFIMHLSHECFYETVEEYKEKTSFKYEQKVYNDKCPHCQAPAYIGLHSIDCSAKCSLSSSI